MSETSPSTEPRTHDPPVVDAAVHAEDETCDRAMDRYAAGDDAAFRLLYRGLAPRLYRYLLRLTRNDAMAQDLLQQTFLNIHGARGRFVSGARVAPWSYAIARRVFLDRRRQQQRVTLVELDESTHHAIAPSGEEFATARELDQLLTRELSSMPENQREAFILVREHHLSVAEAAEVLGTTTTAVKLRTFRASERLREALRNAGFEERTR